MADPVTLGITAITALGGALAGSAIGSSNQPTPTAPATEADTIPPAQAPQPKPNTGGAPSQTQSSPTFLGAAAATPPVQSGAKTLLGQ